MFELVKEWITLTIAVLGFGLGLWSRIESWREKKEKRESLNPYAKIEFNGQERIVCGSTSRRPIAVVFTNPGRNRWRVNRIEIIEPKDSTIVIGHNDETWSKAINIEWVLTEASEANGLSKGQLSFRFRRLDPNVPIGPPREIALRIFATEVSAKRRRIAIEARTARQF